MVADKKKLKFWVKEQNSLHKKAVYGLVFQGFLNVILGCAQAWFLARALACILDSSMKGFLSFVFWFFAICLLRLGLNVVQDLMAFSAGQKARSRLRRQILAQIFSAGPSLLRTTHSARIAALLVDNVESLEGYFARWLPSSVLWAPAQWFVVVVLYWQNHRAGLILGISCLLLPVFQAVFGIATGRASRKQFLALSRLQRRFLDRLRGLATIVMAGRSEDEAQALAESADELRQRTMKVLRIAFLTSASTDLVMIIALVGIVITESRYLLHTGSVEQAASALFAVFVVPEAFAPFRAFSAAYQDRARATETAEVAVSLPAVETDPAQKMAVSEISAPVTITFDHVWYRWSAERGWVLNDVSFTLSPDEILLLTGPSGAGKSTLLELVLGFIKPGKGQIYFNGQDSMTIAPASLAQTISYLGQKPLLFYGTLKENILFARPDASEEELHSALKAAQLEVVVSQLPNGLETLIGEGGFGLSGGQIQRLAIARAYLKKSSVILMDEPTAHLDRETEQEIILALKPLLKGKTVIIATHSEEFDLFDKAKSLHLLHSNVSNDKEEISA
ncbi:thiol reductant ABC exporter subunit CydD [Acetobacteraceae bacterium ESL0709]|nr:thiol reductant ABC exporter subunit CydD [Acetobacteraceae bacterium ESL0697]MDF7678033.1 thiol reductant ABC exporter subunit CydD [Acetobacteraceae bacterium ESL0709]